MITGKLNRKRIPAGPEPLTGRAVFFKMYRMIDTCLTRAYLETLSAAELLKLADKYYVDIPDGLERIFIIEELLENFYGNEDKNHADNDMVSDFLEAAVLPRQYNISFIDVIIRDPLWAFVFWELKSHEREQCEKAPDFEGYCLKAVPVYGTDAQEAKLQNNTDQNFIVPLGLNDSARYLGFPRAEGSFRIELCAVQAGQPLPLISSGPFRMPRLLESPDQKDLLSAEFQELYNNPLMSLSGAQEFPVIRSVERRVSVREYKTRLSGC